MASVTAILNFKFYLIFLFIKSKLSHLAIGYHLGQCTSKVFVTLDNV